MTETERQELLIKAYYSTFNTAEGQIILNDLQDKFYRRTFITQPIDSNSILVNEGARSVVIYILSKIEELELQNGRRELERQPSVRISNE